MFRCTDCGQEYEVKPDYCDCGNDLFEEITETAPNPTPAVKSTIPQRPELPRRTVDLPSLIIFLTCIVLSVLSWIFIGRDTTQTEPAVAESAPKTVNIPSIDKLWKENPAPVKIVEPEPVAPPAPVVVSKPAPKSEPKKITILPQKKPAAKPVTTSKPVAPAQPPQKTVSPSMTEAQKQEIIKKLTASQKPQTAAPAPVKKAEEPKPAQVTKAPEPQPQPPKIDYAAQKKELLAYKTALRNKLGGNINFAAVIGDGKCAITFKIDGTGNLTNRAFSVQSSNDSLNDAVYAAMMQNPTFKAPPAGYKNETLTLSVQIYGGNFEVSLK